MAILTKGSRRIVVDEQPFRWRVRHKPTYGQSLCWATIGLCVAAEGGQGAVLIVSTAQYHPENWFNTPLEPVLPHQVADSIQLAKKLGWQPLKAGKPFWLDYESSARLVFP
ncbi:hypothetical protein LJY25_16780 [Hymenobacter sp. BT175]|uniref:hypothetical protein n=1 Tax=Hymenobacter translucens TaxID=2886507 RepID=UPI001D0E3616|nr:hypothetical protein [Hymenobacter translucens]MCC2548107.1 hypothetical protein [Hymenobacter translucens]